MCLGETVLMAIFPLSTERPLGGGGGGEHFNYARTVLESGDSFGHAGCKDPTNCELGHVFMRHSLFKVSKYITQQPKCAHRV